MKKVFSFCNQKGGVGKTTSAINLSTLIAKAGYRVLLIDVDAQANATSGLGEEKPSIEFTTFPLLVDNTSPGDLIRQTKIENLDLIPSNADLSGAELELIGKENREFGLKSKLEKLKNDYDFIFIDCPPSLGLITINALTASDYIIIPLQCEYFALEGLSQLLNSFQLVKKNLNASLEIGGVLLTMADFRTNLTQQVIEEVKKYFQNKVFNAVIPRTVKLSEAPSFGQPAVLYDPNNKGSKSYADVAKEFIARFGANKKILEEKKTEIVEETTGHKPVEIQTEVSVSENNEKGEIPS